MTMQNQTHPDDERLSALAGGDPEAAGDVALRAHLDGCQRCASLVRDLGELRLALAQLPDLPPSRPLQLVPPVIDPEPAASGGRAGWLRRLAAPAMAAGAALAVVGGIGFGAVSLSGLGASGAAPALREDAADNAQESEAPAEPQPGEAAGHSPRLNYGGSSDHLSAGASPSATVGDEPASEDGTSDEEAGERLALESVDFNRPAPWLVVLAAGVALLVLGLLLRSSVRPRAG